MLNNSNLEGQLKLIAQQDTSVSEHELVMILPDGELVRGGELKTMVYSLPLPNNNCIDKYGNEIEGTPVWVNAPGKLFTGSDCPNNTKVGIQTNNPEAQLHINTRLPFDKRGAKAIIVENNTGKILQLDNNGLLLTREVKVNQSNWPDYVFEDGYQLLNLKEVENFILEKGHLPNVPSAQEIENNGSNLGDTDKILLEKIEELTLYLIKQNKELERLKTEIEKLKN